MTVIDAILALVLKLGVGVQSVSAHQAELEMLRERGRQRDLRHEDSMSCSDGEEDDDPMTTYGPHRPRLGPLRRDGDTHKQEGRLWEGRGGIRMAVRCRTGGNPPPVPVTGIAGTCRNVLPERCNSGRLNVFQ